MLLVFDIGNSNIVLGTYEGKRLMKHWRISTDRQKTGDEYGMLINNLFRFQGIRMTDIDAIIISSVVPPLVVPLVKMCERYFRLRPLMWGRASRRASGFAMRTRGRLARTVSSIPSAPLNSMADR